MKNLIVLVGMMGSGKSTIGRMLARVLKYKFIDTDKDIEKLKGMTISQIFNTYGENYFRNIEQEFVLNLCNEKNAVISFGGGTFENETIRNIFQKNATTIYLKTSAKTLFQRIKTSITRPLLHERFSVETLAFILKKRAKNYQQAHYEIDTDNKTKKEIVISILNLGIRK